MKYHYSYRFFTYSVKRNRDRKILVSGVEVLNRWSGVSLGFAIGVTAGAARYLVVRRKRDLIGASDRVRSALKTVSGGEFDWGGTSVN